jgi:hypothetical protein
MMWLTMKVHLWYRVFKTWLVGSVRKYVKLTVVVGSSWAAAGQQLGWSWQAYLIVMPWLTLKWVGKATFPK